jgi:EpsI family protein
MSSTWRTAIGVSILTAGLCATKALDAASGSTRPELSQPLSSLPMTLGDWIGRDEPVEPEVIQAAQTDDYLSRVYKDPRRPGLALVLWVNYSRLGLNLRHSPEICLPGGGFTKLESQTLTLEIPRNGAPLPITRLAYAKGELVQSIGFWYYIFGEGSVERFVRKLPITSRSSHGRTTRGSALTAEVFYPGDSDPDGMALRDFTQALLPALEKILPQDRANYHIP